MKRILITGITGFVGKNLVHYFQSNKDIIILGHSRNTDQAISNLASYNVDFLPDFTSQSINDNTIDTIIHLAGIAHDLSGVYYKKDYQEAILEYTRNLYSNFLASSANTFVFVSSIKAVIDYSDKIIDEHTIPAPSSDYGIFKKQAEEYLINQPRAGKKVYILRPCMIHGPGNKGNLNLLYKFVKTGIPYPLGAFENKRSFLSIDNFCFVIDGILSEKLKEGIYLLADTDPISTKSLIRLIGNVGNRKVRILHFPKILMRILAEFGTVINAPFNKKILNKLCDNMVVSNRKLLLNLGQDLPLTIEEGLKKTIKSFDE